jgi:hypothetical protein
MNKTLHEKTPPIKLFEKSQCELNSNYQNILYLDCKTSYISNMRKFVLLNNIRNHINFIKKNIIELSNYCTDYNKIEKHKYIYFLELCYYYIYIILYIYRS